MTGYQVILREVDFSYVVGKSGSRNLVSPILPKIYSSKSSGDFRSTQPRFGSDCFQPKRSRTS